MPRNKQNEHILNQQEVNYIDLIFSKSQQKQRIPKKEQSSVISSNEPVYYAELKLNRTSHLQHRKSFVREKKDPGSIAWHVISGILGVLCMALLTTVGILLSNLLSNREEKNRKYLTVSSKNNECSHDLCSHNWIGFGNSFYHSFDEPKTWPESQTACMELNSHLLKIENQEELEFLSTFDVMGWIGLKENETDGSWLWEDGIQVNESLTLLVVKKSKNCAYVSGNYIYSESCSTRKKYICEFNI